ncbi:box C/D snoRNA protein 1 [Megalobrama amblycephala]|uniref:box C/D snoRNA protein 1 n=1 Tax=Megalobrama amblycephala TaxID=75352 RepID=UPI0020144999|nr:box C/D snoRNA protein 1 [Megalobrama amblycephala]
MVSVLVRENHMNPSKNCVDVVNMLPVNNNEADDDRRGVKRKMALSSCDVCETEEAKYRCPSCMKHTCSLACVKQHKMVSGCCGVRDKTAFVPLAEFNEITLLSDYRFLEDTARLRQQSNRDAVLLASRRHPKECMWMIRKAKAAKVTLKLLPKMFSKHRENRTIFKSTEGRFHWHLKIHFPQSNAVYSERFPDNKLLDEILNDYIHPSESDPVKRQKLKVYVHSPQEDIRVFLKAEQKQANSPRYLELDLKKSLQENLMHKTIVEYPEVFVVLKQHSQEFLAHRPEHSSAVQCVSRAPCSPAEPHSEAPVHVAKRTKVVPEDDELEDGELRSDEEDESAEDDDDAGDENKVPVSHHDDDSDEEELHNSVLDAPVDCANTNEAVSVNIPSGTEKMMVVSGDVQDSTETFIDDGSSLCEGSKIAVSPHDCQQNIPELSDEDKNGDNGAKHDKDGKTDSQHDCVDKTQSSLCDRSDASEIEGQENTQTSASRENTNIYSNETHVDADVQLA